MREETHTMICKKCGAVNEDYLEYCKVCAEELEKPAERPEPKRTDSNGRWSFVDAPSWPKPELNADSVSEDEVTAYVPRRSADRMSGYSGSDATAGAYSRAPEAAPRQAAQRRNSVSRTYDCSENGRMRGEEADTYGEEAERRPRYDRYEAERAPRAARTYAQQGNASRYAPVEEDDDIYRRPSEDAQHSFEKPKQIKYADPIDDDYFYDGDDDDDNGFERRRSRSGGHGALIKAVIIGVVAVAVIVGIVLLITSGALAGVFGSKEKLPTIETTTLDNGDRAYLLTVYAKNGSTVRFECGSLKQDETVKSGNELPLRIPEAIWMPTEPVDGTVAQVVPSITVIDKNGVETRLEKFITRDASIVKAIAPETSDADIKKGVEITYVPIAVPSLTLMVENPSTDTFETDQNVIAVTGRIDNNTAAVFVNDVQVPVDDTGAFKYDLQLTQAGETTVTIEARKAGYQIARRSITVLCTASGQGGATKPDPTIQTGNITITTTQLRTKTDTITVNGTTLPNSTVEVVGGDLTGPATVAADGSFSFTVKLPEVGFKDLTVNATCNGAVSSTTVHVERCPADYKEFIENSQGLDYDRCVSSPNHKQDYSVKCTVSEIINAEPYVIAKVTFASGREAYFIYYNSYEGAAEIEVGKTYRICCIPNGLYQDTQKPYLYVWFVLSA